jgi:hypothetical protein
MRFCNKNKNIIVAVIAVALVSSCLNLASADSSKHLTLQPRAGTSAPQNVQGQPTVTITQVSNGITVGEPQVYDDALLQEMLQNAEARLATLQLIDQAKIAEKLGAMTGASQQVSSFGLNVQGAPVPGVTTTSKGATGSTTQTTAAGATASSFQTTSGLATQDVVTTTSQVGSPPVSAPAPTTTLPSAFSVSSSDILNEQMQLTAEINGLRLLLAGSLSGHFIRGEGDIGNNMSKLKTTLGFPITVTPDKRYKDAVAVVEVEVEKILSLSRKEPPVITALLPREKTYNVAAITDKSMSIGGGVATQILGFSGSWLRGYKTYYLVQDQDTVALTFNPENEPQARKKVGFLWEFRPVLGRQYVKAGLKQTFVQLAFPSPADAVDEEIGKVTVRTYWRKYDRKSSITKEIIPDSLCVDVLNFDIPRFSLAIKPPVFNARDSLEDLGSGQMLVKLPGRFLPGTNIRVGNTILAEGPQFKHQHFGILFISSISDLATKGVFLTAHDGTETRLKFKETICSERTPVGILKNPLRIVKDPRTNEPRITVTTVDEANSRVTVELNHPELADGSPRLVFVIGQRVFGYSDAPLLRMNDYLSAIVPTALIVANPLLTVQTLFPLEGCSDRGRIPGFQTLSQTERLLVLEQGKDLVKFLLYGNRLKDAEVISPFGVTLQRIGGKAEDGDTLLLVELNNDQLKSNKALLVQRKGERPFLVPIPALETKEIKKAEPPKARERVTVGADEVMVDGDGMKELEKVNLKGQKVALPFQIAEDGKSVKLKNLRAFGVTSIATTQTLVFAFKSGKPVEVSLEIVNTKVETVAK